MKRLRCGETSCVHHTNGCTADCVQVSEQRGTPCCATYETSDVTRLTAAERFSGYGNGMLGDGIATARFAQTEFGEAEPQRRAELYRVSCTASDCLRNHDCACRAAWLEIGFPKEGDGVDIRCKSYVSGCGQGRMQNAVCDR